ncbi:MAG: 3,4-dihydroxy-2-butanone-4-phosphate synthase [Hyphomicrobiales bacterium]|nr:3,4-dihydroxy-2-butanone-4-phosphate synthase [Hyphomicrobiales bacterium]
MDGFGDLYGVTFDTIESALDDLRAGKFVVVLDHPGREGQGDLVASAAAVTPEMVNFMLSQARGSFIAVCMKEDQADRMQLPLLVPPVHNAESQKTCFRLTCDTAFGTTGCSAAERAQTVNILGGVIRHHSSDPNVRAVERASNPMDLVRPGHVVPITAHPKGLAARNGHTEASCELMRLAGIRPAVAVDMQILSADGRVADAFELREFANRFDLKLISVPQLCEWLDVDQTTAAPARVAAVS